ncbi:MAG: peptide chain release factor 1, partial [Planctomycetes bacterium]|nr:peptide chain release factor 1 [Planctomycetota bacterium]
MSFLRPRIQQRLDSLVARHEQLMVQSADPEVLARPERLAALQRELGSATEVVGRYRAFTKLLADIEEHRALADGGDELAELARAELPGLEERARSEADALIDLLLAEQGDDRRDCIVEIRAGTGGEEAALFAKDLCTIYQRFAARRGWTFEPMHATPTEQGGFKEILFTLRGQSVFHYMQFESGGHRVQRVPKTESQGRIHTSMVTVVVLPQVEEVDIEIDKNEVRVDKFCASGPGGQHVNKTESAIRLTHEPTGIVVQCQDEKSQHKNLDRAWKVLRARVADHFKELAEKERGEQRKTLRGRGMRNERIRTYNFPQDRCTDHRIGHSIHGLDQILQGDVDSLIDKLIEHDKEEAL